VTAQTNRDLAAFGTFAPHSPAGCVPAFTAVRSAGAVPAALRSVFLRVAAGALAGTIAGCGGGTDAPGPPAPVPVPAPPAPLSAVLSVPTPVGYDADRLAAFDRLNAIRLSAGLGMLAQSTQLDQAAQAHADWVIANDSFSHQESAGTVGFTGVAWWNRDAAAGYASTGGAEVMAANGQAIAEVDALTNMLYHRECVLSFSPVDVGIGYSSGRSTSLSRAFVADITSPSADPIRSVGQTAQGVSGGVVAWPLDGATGVPTRMGLESPNPVPTLDVSTLGTPASISVDLWKRLTVTSFVMTLASTGEVVASRLLQSSNDPNHEIGQEFVGIVPTQPLLPQTRYSVTFIGASAVSPYTSTTPIQRTWSFSTASP